MHEAKKAVTNAYKIKTFLIFTFNTSNAGMKCISEIKMMEQRTIEKYDIDRFWSNILVSVAKIVILKANTVVSNLVWTDNESKIIPDSIIIMNNWYKAKYFMSLVIVGL